MIERAPLWSVRGLALRIGGSLLLLSGVSLVAMTLRSEIAYRAATALHGGEVVDLGHDTLAQAGQHGFMARLVGTPAVVEAPHDPQFNQQANTPVLKRRVEMFQWREIRIGNGVHYEQDWVDHPVDSSRFAQPRGHANPGPFPLQGASFDAGRVQLGGFKLAPVLVRDLPGTQPLAPTLAALPANLAASFSAYDGYLVTSAHPTAPRLGDLRVSWEQVPLQTVTVVARIDGDHLTPAVDARDGKGYHVEVGDVSLLDIYPDLPLPPTQVVGSQVIAVLLASFGAFMLLLATPRRRDPLLALALGLLAVGAVAAVLAMGHDKLVLIVWLGLVLLAVAVSVWRLGRHRVIDG